MLSELGFWGFGVGCLGDCGGLRWWLFGVPHPFVRPGHPHPGPLPPSGRGNVLIVGDGFSWGLGRWGDGLVFNTMILLGYDA